MNLRKILAIAVIAMMLVPAAAFAQSSRDGYAGPNNVVSGIEQGGGGGGGGNGGSGDGGTVVRAADNGGSLPFTGADLGVLAAAGGMLLALGFGLRRLTHRPAGV